MKQIVVISGKGGTGKTMLTASLAALAKKKVMADCDVDAADLHLLLHPTIRERNEFRSGKTASIDRALCQECGECISICRFDAIREDYAVDPISCEGCGVCFHICPASAISMEENVSGEWFISDTKYGLMVHATLGIAEENSGKLVTKVRQAASALAEKEDCNYVIIDGPPGVGCPVMASLTGVDAALIVTEPTLSGIHDMERVARVAAHFRIPAKVIINKYDMNPENTAELKQICKNNDMEMIGQIPYSKKIIESIVAGMPYIEYRNDRVTEEIIHVWDKIK